MPTYDYQCFKCNHTFEDLKKVLDRKEPESAPCPNCNELNSVKLLLSPTALIDPVVLGVRKPDLMFRERMKQIKDNHKNVKSLQGKIKDY